MPATGGEVPSRVTSPSVASLLLTNPEGIVPAAVLGVWNIGHKVTVLETGESFTVVKVRQWSTCTILTDSYGIQHRITNKSSPVHWTL